MLAPDTIALAAELEALGGGDARVGAGSALAIVRRASGASVVATHGARIRVRDPKLPPRTPEDEAVRRFRVSATPEGPTQLFEAAGAPALEWVLAGFNAAIVAIGEAGAGKSHALFGPDGASEPERHGLCPRLLAELYDVIEARHADAADDEVGPGTEDEDAYACGGLTLGIACWEVRHDRVVDLLCAGGPDGLQAASAAERGGPHPYVLVHAPGRRDAARLLTLARQRSTAARSSAPGSGMPQPARASLFVRLALHDGTRQSLASLYLADLVGVAPLPNASEAAALAALLAQRAPSTAITPGALIAERRGLNRQHAAVHRMLAELGALGEGSGPQQVLGARDSRLTQQLAPLLVGSCRSQILACVHAGADHFAETCATLRAAAHALALRAPCLRLLGVALSELRLVAPSSVLPPDLPIGSSVHQDGSDDSEGFAVESQLLGWEDEYDDVEDEYDKYDVAQQASSDVASKGLLPSHHKGAASSAEGSGSAAGCARLRGAGGSDTAPTPTGSTALRADVQDMMAQLGSSQPSSPTARSSGKAPDNDASVWVTRELERRMQEELAIARSVRARGPSVGASQPPTPAPPVVVENPVIRSYAAQHAAHSHVQRRLDSLASLGSPQRNVAAYTSHADSAGTHSRSSISNAEMEAAIASQAQYEAQTAQREAQTWSLQASAAAEANRIAHEASPIVVPLEDHVGSDGQDAVVDGTALREGNYETVLTLLKESHDARRDERVLKEEAERDAFEKVTLSEIALAEEKAKVLELRKKLRRLEGISSHASAFELYDADIESLTVQLDAARMENIELEAACREASMAYEVARDAARQASGEEWPSGISASMEAKLGRVKTYRRALSSSEKELKELRAVAAENARTVRQAEVYRRSADDATKRLHKLAKEHAKAVAELTSARLQVAEAAALKDAQASRVREAQRGEDEAKHAASAQQDEVTTLREQIKALEYERRKDAVVLRMAPRLQSSAEKLRAHLMKSGRERNAPRAPPLARGAGALTAPEALLALEKELATNGKSPKATILLQRAIKVVDALEVARQEGQEREDELLQLLVESASSVEGVGNCGQQPQSASGAPNVPALAGATMRR